jgi:DNA/RNA endonuclease YhcR with UshA esterase domain
MYPARLAITSAVLGIWASSAGAVSIDPSAAMTVIGRNATVCGIVASADYMVGSRANPTFLTVVNPNQPDPKGALTAVIYGHDRAKFGAPEAMLQGQRVCVTGYISFFRGRPEMILSSPRQMNYYAPPNVAQLR